MSSNTTPTTIMSPEPEMMRSFGESGVNIVKRSGTSAIAPKEHLPKIHTITDVCQMFSRFPTRTDSRNKTSSLLNVFRYLIGTEGDGNIEITENNNQEEIECRDIQWLVVAG